jgi:hypothetical protein
VARKQDAVGTPLPNLEEPQQLIARWDDRPPVAGVAPLPRDSSLRGERGYLVDIERQTTKMRPEAFSWAHPAMIAPRYPAGEPVNLAGVRPGSPWRFVMPSPSLALSVHLGERSYQLPMVPDTVYFLPSAQQVVVVARCSFVYQFVPERRRRMRIIATPSSPLERPTTTIAEQRRAVAPALPVTFDVSPELSFLPIETWVDNHPFTEIVEALPLCPSS